MNPASKTQGTVSAGPGQSGVGSRNDEYAARERPQAAGPPGRPSAFGPAKRADGVPDAPPATSSTARPSAFGSGKRADSVPDAPPATRPAAKASAFGSARRPESGAAAPGESAEIAKELQGVVDDLAPLVANAVAAVPGAENLSADELTQLVSEVLAGR